jgi:hypothetical protein
MAKRKVGNQIVWHTVGKISTRYNFVSDFIPIGGLHTKLWPFKVVRVQILGISKLPLGSPGTKWHLGANPVAMHKIYYKGEGGGFPQVWAEVSLMSLNLLVVHRSTRKCSNFTLTNLLFGFVQVRVSDWLLIILPSLIPKLQRAPLPPKCCELGSMPQFLIFSLFSPQTHIWIYQGTWEHVRYPFIFGRNSKLEVICSID